MSYVLFPESATLRRWSGSTLDADGFSAKLDETTTPIAGSFQPVTRAQVDEDLLAEGVEKVAFIDTSLWPSPRPLSIADGTPADEIDFAGETYRVVRVEEWSTGWRHAKAYLTRRLA